MPETEQVQPVGAFVQPPGDVLAPEGAGSGAPRREFVGVGAAIVAASVLAARAQTGRTRSLGHVAEVALVRGPRALVHRKAVVEAPAHRVRVEAVVVDHEHHRARGVERQHDLGRHRLGQDRQVVLGVRQWRKQEEDCLKDEEAMGHLVSPEPVGPRQKQAPRVGGLSKGRARRASDVARTTGGSCARTIGSFCGPRKSCGAGLRQICALTARCAGARGKGRLAARRAGAREARAGSAPPAGAARCACNPREERSGSPSTRGDLAGRRIATGASGAGLDLLRGSPCVHLLDRRQAARSSDSRAASAP